MRRAGAFLARLLVILAGYLAASLAASAVLHVALLTAAGPTASELAPLAVGSILSVPFAALFVAYIALVPAALAIALAEALGINQAWAYCLLGAATGLGVLALFRQAGIDEPSAGASAPLAGETGFALVLVAGGIVAGFVYWLASGRFALGFGRAVPAPDASDR